MSLSVEDLAGRYHQAWTHLDVDAIVARQVIHRSPVTPPT